MLFFIVIFLLVCTLSSNSSKIKPIYLIKLLLDLLYPPQMYSAVLLIVFFIPELMIPLHLAAPTSRGKQTLRCHLHKACGGAANVYFQISQRYNDCFHTMCILLPCFEATICGLYICISVWTNMGRGPVNPQFKNWGGPQDRSRRRYVKKLQLISIKFEMCVIRRF